MDERDGDGADRSPWARDDWVPEPFEATWGSDEGPHREAGGALAAVGQDDVQRRHGEPTTPSHRRRSVLVAGAVALACVAAIVAVVERGGGSDVGSDHGGATSEFDPGADPVERDADRGAAAAATTASDAEELVPDAAVEPPASPVASSVPNATVATPSTEDPGDPTERVPVPEVVDGQEPAWAITTIDVPAPLSQLTVPTEVVTVTGEAVLHRTEFPSGRTRSVGVELVGATPELVVGDEAIVLYSGTRLLVVPDEGPVSAIEVGDGVVFVQARPNTSEFIVTTPATAPGVDEQELVLTPDGGLEPLDAGRFRDAVFWARTFLPTGDLVLNGPGGVYAITSSDSVERLSPGDLVAVGANHFAVEECDAEFVCSGWIVDVATRERTPAVLDGVGNPGFIDPSTRISPDGGAIVFRDNTRGTGVRRVVDVATGDGVDVGAANEIVFADTWAADSSGLFGQRNGDLRYQGRDGMDVVLIDQLGSVVGVASRSAR